METFNQLPIELLEKIEYLFKIPEIDIYRTYSYGCIDFYFRVKYQWMKLDIQMMSSNKLKLSARIRMLNDFIEKLINNEPVYYCEDDSNEDDDNRRFEIIYDLESINISNRETDLDLDINCKDQLIIALQKYRNMLSTK